MAVLADRRATLARFAVGAIAFAYAAGALLVALDPGEFSTYAGRSIPAAALAVLSGLALVSSGLVISVRPSTRFLGGLALAAGFVWFAPFWVGWAGGPSVVRSIGMVLAGFLLPLLLHVVLAYPNGQIRTALARWLVAAVYTEAALSAVARALFRDPFLDPTCWDNCTDNVFLVHASPAIADTVQVVDISFAMAAAGALATFCLWRLIAATAPARRAIWPISLAGIVLGAAMAAHSIALLLAPEDPVDRTFLSIFTTECVAVALVAGGLLWNSLRARLQQRAVGQIVADLAEAPSPGSVKSALARAIGDPKLEISYWLSASERHVDPYGRTVPVPTAAAGRALTTLVRDGRRVAIVSHAESVPELEPEFGAAVRLALDNERLQAEVLAQLVDIRASRSRIVDTGDAERRRLERDLHDGAQQRLLALSYDIRLAAASSRADGDATAASLLAVATSEAEAALADLRELAHGIYPAILTEAGLASAIATLADAASLPVEIIERDEGRYPAPVETAIYLVVSEAIEDAAARNASHVSLSLVRDDDRLILVAEDDGSRRTSEMIHLADRVGAVSGKLAVEPMRIRAEVPCG